MCQLLILWSISSIYVTHVDSKELIFHLCAGNYSSYGAYLPFMCQLLILRSLSSIYVTHVDPKELIFHLCACQMLILKSLSSIYVAHVDPKELIIIFSLPISAKYYRKETLRDCCLRFFTPFYYLNSLVRVVPC